MEDKSFSLEEQQTEIQVWQLGVGTREKLVRLERKDTGCCERVLAIWGTGELIG